MAELPLGPSPGAPSIGAPSIGAPRKATARKQYNIFNNLKHIKFNHIKTKNVY